jgi:radical SAM superfamily enzyme with C-terminal helix-hairpin-helix motif
MTQQDPDTGKSYVSLDLMDESMEKERKMMLPDFEANVRSEIDRRMLDVRLGAVESIG